MTTKTAFRDVFGGFWSLLVGMRITLGQFFKPTITVQYPRQTLQMPARFRGHIKLTLDPETGLSRCTACNLCARACPSECIVLDGAKKEGEKKKSVTEYHLDFTTCSLCGSCVEACASDAIEFSHDYNVVAFSRDAFNHMDLVAKLEEERKVWAQNRPPQPPAAPVPAAAAAPAPAAATPPATPAAPAVAGVADPSPASTRPATSKPAPLRVVGTHGTLARRADGSERPEAASQPQPQEQKNTP